MKDAWDDYVKYAFGENELKPISQTGQTENMTHHINKAWDCLIQSIIVHF